MPIKRMLIVVICVVSAVFGTSAFAADNSAILGKWAMVIDAQGKVFEVDLNITEEAGKLTGSIMSLQGGGPVSNMVFENDQLSYVSDDGQGGSIKTTLKLENGELKGNLATQMGEIPITGKR